MAFSLSGDKSFLKVVVSKDSAVTCSPEEYREYLLDLDETKLKLNGVPTRFVLRKTLDYKAHQTLMRSQAKYVKGQVEPDISSLMTEIRLHWVDVENSTDIPETQHIIYKKDSDQYANKELVAGLQSFGVLMDLQVALRNSQEMKSDDVTKKS